MNIQGWFPLGSTGLVSLQSKGLSRVFSSTTVQKHQFFSAQPSLMVQLPYLYMPTEKTIALTIWTFVSKVMSLLLNMLSRFVIAFLPRSKLGESIILSAYKTLISIQVSLLRIHFFSILLQLLYNCVCPLQCVYEINKNSPKAKYQTATLFPNNRSVKRENYKENYQN